MGTVGVIVNCALIGLSGQVNRMFPNITATQTILLIIVLEVHLTAQSWTAVPSVFSFICSLLFSPLFKFQCLSPLANLYFTFSKNITETFKTMLPQPAIEASEESHGCQNCPSRPSEHFFNLV